MHPHDYDDSVSLPREAMTQTDIERQLPKLRNREQLLQQRPRNLISDRSQVGPIEESPRNNGGARDAPVFLHCH